MGHREADRLTEGQSCLKTEPNYSALSETQARGSCFHSLEWPAAAAAAGDRKGTVFQLSQEAWYILQTYLKAITLEI